jgi:hypothetical protein
MLVRYTLGERIGVLASCRSASRRAKIGLYQGWLCYLPASAAEEIIRSVWEQRITVDYDVCDATGQPLGIHLTPGSSGRRFSKLYQYGSGRSFLRVPMRRFGEPIERYRSLYVMETTVSEDRIVVPVPFRFHLPQAV